MGCQYAVAGAHTERVRRPQHQQMCDIIKRNIAAFYPLMLRCSWETERILQGNILSSGLNEAKGEGGAGGWWKYGAMHLCVTAGFHKREARICCKTMTGCIYYRSESGMCFYAPSVYQTAAPTVIEMFLTPVWLSVKRPWSMEGGRVKVKALLNNNNNIQQYTTQILLYQGGQQETTAKRMVLSKLDEAAL